MKIFNAAPGTTHLLHSKTGYAITFTPGLNEIAESDYQKFEERIRSKKHLHLIFDIPEVIPASQAPPAMMKETLPGAGSDARSGLPKSGSNSDRSAEARFRVRAVAEDYRRQHGKLPSRNSLAQLAKTSRDLASRVLNELKS